MKEAIPSSVCGIKKGTEDGRLPATLFGESMVISYTMEVGKLRGDLVHNGGW